MVEHHGAAAHTARHKAVFLDRDGVINRPVVEHGKPYPPASIEGFEIYPEVPAACAAMKGAGYLLVVVTNQPDVGRGVQSREVVEQMHAVMLRRLPIDRVEVCYEDNSAFHKPAPGMVLRVAHELGIDLKASFLVGDRWRDVDCGKAAGCETIFIDRGYEEPLRSQPEHTVSDLREAARVILQYQAPRKG
jgi:D-glycero-D-manno-heptose 1,7-bisphosphate phosphatase